MQSKGAGQGVAAVEPQDSDIPFLLNPGHLSCQPGKSAHELSALICLACEGFKPAMQVIGCEKEDFDICACIFGVGGRPVAACRKQHKRSQQRDSCQLQCVV